MRYLIAFAILSRFTSVTFAQPQITAVVNSATFQPGLPSGGGLATVFCAGVVSVKPGTYLPSSVSPLPNQLAGFQVSINLAYAPILAVVVTTAGSANYAQINFQVPMERNASLRGSQAGGYAGYLSTCGAPSLNTLPPLPMGSFFTDNNGYAIAQHAADYSPVTPANPAHPGETLIGYADDAYEVWPPPPIGIAAPFQPLFQSTGGPESQYPGSYFATGYLYLQGIPEPDIKGNTHPNTLPLKILFAGLAPGMIGVQQINFVVPANQPQGTTSCFSTTAVRQANSYPTAVRTFRSPALRHYFP